MKSWVRVNQDLAVQLNSLLSPVRLPKNRTKGLNKAKLCYTFLCTHKLWCNQIHLLAGRAFELGELISSDRQSRSKSRRVEDSKLSPRYW